MLIDELKHWFGFETFKPGQEAIIKSVLNQQDTLGILPTGSGKSLCYQLPTYIKQQPTLIISPLIKRLCFRFLIFAERSSSSIPE